MPHKHLKGLFSVMFFTMISVNKKLPKIDRLNVLFNKRVTDRFGINNEKISTVFRVEKSSHSIFQFIYGHGIIAFFVFNKLFV